MKTIITLLGATWVGLTLFQCQPAAVFAPEAARPAQSGSARTSAIATDIPVSGYTLCYEDLFDTGTSPNPADWYYRTDSRFGGFNEPSQVSVGGG